jgi:16S rRNA (cytosine1402-N4)-methyltransferase
MSSNSSPSDEVPSPPVHKRRQRYSGKNPRRFEDKYKELQPERYADTVAKVRASGKTPAGQHIPIMLREIMEVLAPQPGERALDCTLGYGGHAEALLRAVQPDGCLMGLDQDAIEIEKTGARLKALAFPEDTLRVVRINFAGLRKALDEAAWSDGVDVILADLGVSSMQIDNPARGFSFKTDGPLDMRMNPLRGVPARELLRKIAVPKLSALLEENADETNSLLLAEALAGQDFAKTSSLAAAVKRALPPQLDEEAIAAATRRVFQALRIAVNDEFGALDSFLRVLPTVLRPGGRVAVLTFHSGEDRRVKKAFLSGFRDGIFSAISGEVQRPSAEEIRLNTRAASAKLRWAVRA